MPSALEGFDINRQADESMNYPATEGRILVSIIETHIEHDSDGNQIRRGIWELSYSYIVDNERYLGNKFSYGYQPPNYELVREYPVRKKVNVYYNPNNPSNSVLYQGHYRGPRNASKHLIVGIFFVSIPIVVILIRIKRR